MRTFLPKIAEAEERLNKALREGLADSLDIQNIQGDDKVVEMDVALLKVGGSIFLLFKLF